MSVNHHFKKIINHNNKYFKHENLILKKNKILVEFNETRLLSNFRWHSDVYKPSLYSEWVDTWSQKKHERILDTCFNFINSKKPILLNNKKS